MKKISVIIPIYNVEKYLNECLNSVIKQSYKNLEILLIDDHGKDNSINIAKNFETQDNRIKILSYGENKGVSFARNYGLKNASGDYILFIDSDDFIEGQYIKELISNIKNNDIIQDNNWIEYYSNNKIIEFSNKNLTPNIWNKLYKKDFLLQNNIFFPNNIKMGEDLCFNYHCLVLTNKIKYIDNKFKYFYRQNNNSATKRLKNNNDILDAFYYLFDILKNNNALSKIPLPLFHLRQHLKYSNNKQKMFKEIKDFFININTNIKENKNIYNKKDLLFFSCILNNNNYYLYRINFIIKRILKIYK